MAGQQNPKKMKFEIQKQMLDEVADEVACSICKIVPREIPLYASPGGDIVCSTCKNANPHANFQQNNLTRAMEKVLTSLPRACKFRKNGCKIAENLNSIEYHEEDCGFRDIFCPFQFCKETCPFTEFFNHMKSKHNADISQGFKHGSEFEKDGSKFTMKSKGILARIKEVDENLKELRGLRYIGIVSEKIFLLHHKIDPAIFGQKTKTQRDVFFWVQIIGSKFETKNFKYSLQVEDPEFERTYSYKGYVNSMDDKKTDLYESCTAGLKISFEILKKCIGDVFTMEIEIEDQKPKEDSNTDEKVTDEKSL